ncbi:MAG: hypothetical protein ACLP8Y_06855 [Thermoplasmata archaeon]
MIAGLVILLILAGSLVAFAVPLRSTTETRVDWFYYHATAGPGTDMTTSTIRGMCAPSGATTVGVFSMTWSTVSGKPVEEVRLWTLNYMTPVNLYVASNASSGGTSFLATAPFPCSQVWILAVASNQAETVNAVATLTYNVTAWVPIL